MSITWGLEIGFILVSSRIGTINDGAPETLKTKTWIRSKSSARAIKKKILLISKEGTPLMLNFLQTKKRFCKQIKQGVNFFNSGSQSISLTPHR